MQNEERGGAALGGEMLWNAMLDARPTGISLFQALGQ